jgi:hypothetical protein
VLVVVESILFKKKFSERSDSFKSSLIFEREPSDTAGDTSITYLASSASSSSTLSWSLALASVLLSNLGEAAFF